MWHRPIVLTQPYHRHVPPFRTPTTRAYRLQPRPQSESPAPLPELEQKRTRRAVVRGWLSEETFWRDVTTRTLAAAIVATGAYLFALGAGYISTPSGAQTLRGIWNVVWVVGLGTLTYVAVIWAMFFRHKPEHSRRRRIVRRTIWVAVMTVICLGTFQAITGAFNDSWVWPFNTPLFHVPMSNE